MCAHDVAWLKPLPTPEKVNKKTNSFRIKKAENIVVIRAMKSD